MSSTFAALADPTRRAILARLSTGGASVQDLAKPFKMTLPAVSKHLKVLERARLIRRSKSAQWRPCYLETAPLKEAADWMKQYQKFWDESFGRLDALLLTMTKEATPVSGKVRKKTKKHK